MTLIMRTIKFVLPRMVLGVMVAGGLLGAVLGFMLVVHGWLLSPSPSQTFNILTPIGAMLAGMVYGFFSVGASNRAAVGTGRYHICGGAAYPAPDPTPPESFLPGRLDLWPILRLDRVLGGV